MTAPLGLLEAWADARVLCMALDSGPDALERVAKSRQVLAVTADCARLIIPRWGEYRLDAVMCGHEDSADPEAMSMLAMVAAWRRMNADAVNFTAAEINQSLRGALELVA